MALLTSALGSLPRSDEVLNQFTDYDNLYNNPTALTVLEDYAKELILKQERIGLDIVNDGEVQRSGYFSVFYDSFDGYLPTAIPLPTILDDGRYWDHHRGQCHRVWERPTRWSLNPAWFKYGAVIVDRLSRKRHLATESVYHHEARVMTRHASKPVKLTMPSPYMIMRTSWHPTFSRDAYPTQQDYLDDIVRHYKPIIKDCEEGGIDIIQFDDDRITLLLDERLRDLLNMEREIDLFLSSLNELKSELRSAASAVHICRAVDHQQISWSEADFLEMIFKNIQCDQISVALNDTPADLRPFSHFPSDSRLLFGIIYTHDYTLETLETMYQRLKSILAFIPIEHVILSSNCGFSPYARERQALALVWNKLSVLVRFAAVVNEAGLSADAIGQADKDLTALRQEQEGLLRCGLDDE
jgi:5-methyltetrahydropteroyltriglutamate--homocysteine methyltransferase